jgi:hypothetical protein
VLGPAREEHLGAVDMGYTPPSLGDETLNVKAHSSQAPAEEGNATVRVNGRCCIHCRLETAHCFSQMRQGVIGLDGAHNVPASWHTQQHTQAAHTIIGGLANPFRCSWCYGFCAASHMPPHPKQHASVFLMIMCLLTLQQLPTACSRQWCSAAASKFNWLPAT